MTQTEIVSYLIECIEVYKMQVIISNLQYINGKLTRVDGKFFVSNTISQCVGVFNMRDFTYSYDRLKSFIFESANQDLENNYKAKVGNIISFKQIITNELLKYNQNIVNINLTDMIGLNQIEHYLFHVDDVKIKDDYEI